MGVLIYIFAFFILVIFLKIFLSFSWLGAGVSLLIFLAIRYVVHKFSEKMDISSTKLGLSRYKYKDESDETLKNILSWPPTFLIMTTSPFWDTSNYCTEMVGSSSSISSCVEDVWYYISEPTILYIVIAVNTILFLFLILGTIYFYIDFRRN